ncbi:MAG: PAS domain S-box protein, partial [Chloroflexi bacterium]|nr:PAS domain S-box protein [Chloroflexota bacterium]
LNRQARLTGVTLVFFCALWILSHAIEIGLPVVSYKESLVGLQLILGMMALTFWLFYIFHYLGPRKLLTSRIYILFGIMPLVAILALSTNNDYGLMWTEIGLDSQNPYLPLQPTYGIIYWACMVYIAMLTLTGSFLIIWNIIRRRYGYRRESIYLLIAAVIPLITAFIEVMGLLSFLKLSVGLSSWTACIGAIILVFNLPRFHTEQAIPIARDAIFERIGDCILVLDMQNRVLDLNPAAEQLLGYKFSDAFGLSIERIWPYQSTAMISFNKMAEAGEELVLDRDGKQRAYDLRISTITDSSGRLTSQVVLLTDITERRLAEKALRESEEQLRMSMENAPDGVYMNDLEGNFLYGNRRCEEILGYKREELIGKNFLELNILPESSLARAAEILQDNINGKSTGPDELDLISKNGRLVPLSIPWPRSWK